MNRKIELLVFLYKKDAVHQSKNINKILEDLGYTEYEPTLRFLKNLFSEDLIDFRDLRPTSLNKKGEMVTDMSGEPDYEAKITTKGIELIEERQMKLDSVRIAKRANRISLGSLFVAFIAAGFSVYQWSLTKTKPDIPTHKTKQSFVSRPKKDPILKKSVPDHRSLSRQDSLNDTITQKKIRN